MDPDKVKHELWSTKVLDYRIQYQTAYSQSSTQSRGGGSQEGEASGAGRGGTINYIPGSILSQSRSKSTSAFASNSFGTNLSWSNSSQTGESSSPMLMPIIGKELSHVQFENLDEQLFRAMAVLHDQKQRQCVVRTADMKAPVSLFTPFVKEALGKGEWIERYRMRVLKNLECASTGEAAKMEILDRKKMLDGKSLNLSFDEATTARTRIRFNK
jgi:hypothetical protein